MGDSGMVRPLSAVGYRLSAVGYRLSAIGYRQRKPYDRACGAMDPPLFWCLRHHLPLAEAGGK